MKENKYYTPEIDEFFVGFEFEELFKQKWNRLIPPPKDSPNEWVKLKLDTSHSISRIISKIKQDKVRVKYLDKQDLIELGFNKDPSGVRYFEFNGFQLYFDIHQDFNVTIYNDDSIIVFQGDVKNKSELIKVLKMLGIK